MQAQIVQMKPRDPREQDVATAESIRAAAEACAKERADAGYPPEVDGDGYQLPVLGVTAPIQATVTRLVTEDMCIGCGLPMRLHRALDGKRWVGCVGALAKQLPPKSPERWNDPWPGVTCEVRKALMVDCGPDLEIHCAHYTHDELLAIASMLAKAAIAAYRREMEK
jgi:hypothetical protein